MFLTTFGSVFAFEPHGGAQISNKLPSELIDIGIKEKLGSKINLDLKFKNELGQDVRLGDYFKADKPVLLTIVYYRCPNLCNYHLNGLTRVLKNLNWNAGKEFEIVAVSMDPNETPDMASNKKNAYVQEYERPGTANGWHFLTGTESAVKTLTNEIGFQYKWNPKTKQWIHTAAAYVLTPTGVLSRYLLGIEFDARNLKLSMLDASKGKIGNFVDRFALFCFQFDPDRNIYTLYAYNLMRFSAGATVVILAAFLVPFWLRQKRSKETKGVTQHD